MHMTEKAHMAIKSFSIPQCGLSFKEVQHTNTDHIHNAVKCTTIDFLVSLGSFLFVCLLVFFFLLTLRNNKNIPKIIVGSLSSVAVEA